MSLVFMMVVLWLRLSFLGKVIAITKPIPVGILLKELQSEST